MNDPLLLELENVSLHLGQSLSTTLALDHVSLKIPLSCHTAILGPNGSGKSSLLKLLMRLQYPDPIHGNSRISIMGRDDWNVWELRRQLGYVSSELDHHFTKGRSGRLTAIDAVLTGFFSSELELAHDEITEEMRALALDAMKRCRIENLVDRCLAELSTGERRRVLIARALAHQPLGLVLDEPTSGLDLGARALLLEQLEQIAALGTTLILVTHHIEEVIPLFQNVILLKEGKIEFQGNRKESLSSSRLSTLFGVHLTIHENQSQHLYAIIE